MLLHVFRRLLRTPGFSLLVIATVVFAAGVNAGLISVTRSLLGVSPGIPELDHLVHYTLGSGRETIPFSGPAFEALHASMPSTGLALWNNSVGLLLRTPEGAARVSGALVNGSFFRVMKLQPALGRFFDETEDRPGGGDSAWPAVIGYLYWKTRYHGDPGAIGASLVVDGAPVRIAGVLPERFRGLNPPAAIQMLLPRHFLSVTGPGQDRFARAGNMEWEVFGRLQERESLDRIAALLHAVEPRVRKAADPDGDMLIPENFPGVAGPYLLSAHAGDLSPAYGLKSIRTPLFILHGLAGIILILCACNLIFLFVGRRERQAREAAIRLALGATRWNLLPGVVSEAVVLAALGSLIAVPVAQASARALSVIVQSAGGLETVQMAIPDPFLLWAAAGLAVAATAIIAVATGLWVGGSRAGSLAGNLAIARRSNHWAVRCEVLLSMVLFTTAACGVIGFERVLHEPSGFAAETAVTASLGFLGGEGRPGNSGTKILEAIAESPGIQAAAAVNVAPFSGGSARTAFSVHLPDGSVRNAEGLWPEEVSLQYFRAAGTRIRRGRDFAPGDLAGVPACLISSSAAKALFGTADPLAQTIYTSGARGSLPAYCRVIGMSEDAHLRSMSQAPEQVIYRLTDQPMPNLVVRAASPGVAMRAIRNAVRRFAPMSLASSVEPLKVRIDEDLRLTRLLTICAALSAGVTGVIMAVGVFGVLAIEVTARRRDMGIRISLGAGSREIAKALLQRFFSGLALSLGLGSAWGALIVLWLLEKDWISAPLGAAALLAGLGLLVVVMLAAAYAPLRRALDISPIECLRSE